MTDKTYQIIEKSLKLMSFDNPYYIDLIQSIVSKEEAEIYLSKNTEKDANNYIIMAAIDKILDFMEKNPNSEVYKFVYPEKLTIANAQRFVDALIKNQEISGKEFNKIFQKIKISPLSLGINGETLFLSYIKFLSKLDFNDDYKKTMCSYVDYIIQENRDYLINNTNLLTKMVMNYNYLFEKEKNFPNLYSILKDSKNYSNEKIDLKQQKEILKNKDRYFFQSFKHIVPQEIFEKTFFNFFMKNIFSKNSPTFLDSNQIKDFIDILEKNKLNLLDKEFFTTEELDNMEKSKVNQELISYSSKDFTLLNMLEKYNIIKISDLKSISEEEYNTCFFNFISNFSYRNFQTYNELIYSINNINKLITKGLQVEVVEVFNTETNTISKIIENINVFLEKYNNSNNINEHFKINDKLLNTFFHKFNISETELQSFLKENSHLREIKEVLFNSTLRFSYPDNIKNTIKEIYNNFNPANQKTDEEQIEFLKESLMNIKFIKKNQNGEILTTISKPKI